MKDLSKMTHIEDLRRVAERKVPRMFYDYVDSGSWTQTTYYNNETDFDRIKLRQKVLRNMDGRSLATTMIGQPVTMPVAIAPTGFTGMMWADGEIHAARAAEKFGIPFCTITDSYLPVEYENGDKILITYVHKVFNGRTIFGRRGQSIAFGCCILDPIPTILSDMVFF